MRLGELLVRSGLLTPSQVELALRAQVMWGGRLGTNVVELFGTNLDALSRLIASQHGLPPACAEHFEAADPVLQRQLAPALAAQYTCIPLRRLGGDRVVLASVAPLDGRARALVADQLGISYKGLVPAIATELRVHYHLERVYGIPRGARYLRSRKPGRVFEGAIDIDVDETLVLPPRTRTVRAGDAVPDELRWDVTPGIEPPRHVDRRHYLLGDKGAPIGRLALVQRRPDPVEPASASLDEALVVLRRATDRDAIARRAVDAAEQLTGGRAVLLVVRGDAAASYGGDIAIPLDEPNLVSAALAGTRFAGAGPANPIDAALLQELGAPAGDLVVAPVGIADQIWSMIVVAVERGHAAHGLSDIAAAAAIAFTRLLRHANR